MKKRLYSLDFIRAVATILIFTFHFNMGTEEAPRRVYNTALFFKNTDFGSVGVSLFFVLSGCALIYSEKNSFSIKQFYKKRIVALFPMFYIAYILCRFLVEVFTPHLYNGIPWKYFILTVFGMDGFLSYRLPNFYVTGEWFLGCIIVFYILYPLIRWCVKKIPVIFAIAIIALNLYTNNHYIFQMPIIWNPLIRVMEFTFGIYCAQYLFPLFEKRAEMTDMVKKNAWTVLGLVISGGIAAFLLWGNRAYFPVPYMTMVGLCGCSVFLLLYFVSDYLTIMPVKKVVVFLSTYSFAIYLVHHEIDFILYAYFAQMELSWRHLFAIYILFILMICLLGVFLQKLTRYCTEGVRVLKQYCIEKCSSNE